MLITNNNISEAQLKIEELIKRSNFISFDLEFSGLHKKINNKTYQGNFDSSPEEVYKTIRAGVQHYYPLQVGFSILTAEEQKNTFHTFYFHPSSKKDFNIDPSTFLFLTNNNYNFEETLRSKLTFIEPKEYSSVFDVKKPSLIPSSFSTNFHTKIEILKSLNYFSLVENPLPLIDSIDTKIESLISKGQSSQEVKTSQTPIKDSITFSLDITEKLTKTLKTETPDITEDKIDKKIYNTKINIRSILFNFLKAKVKQQKEYLTQQNLKMDCYFKIKKEEELTEVKFILSISNTNNIARLRRKRKLKSYHKRDRASSLIKSLLFSNKPLILHSGGFDLLYLIQYFVFDLPENYSDFISNLYSYRETYLENRKLNLEELSMPEKKLFSNFKHNKSLKSLDNEIKEEFTIFDTKRLLSGYNYKEILEKLEGKSLGNLEKSYLAFKAHFEEKGQNILQSDSEDDKIEFAAHHAGYDARITGKLFYLILKLLEKKIDDLKERNLIFLYNSFTSWNLEKSEEERNKFRETENVFLIKIKDEGYKSKTGKIIEETLEKLKVENKYIKYMKGYVVVHIPRNKNNRNFEENLELAKVVRKELSGGGLIVF